MHEGPRYAAPVVATGGAIATPFYTETSSLKPHFSAGVAVFSAATILFGAAQPLTTAFGIAATAPALSVFALATLGGADMLSVYVRQTLVQIVTPNAMRGRVSAVSSLFIGASNELGEFESGLVARVVGPVGAAIFGGVGALIVTAIWSRLFPALRQADSLTGD